MQISSPGVCGAFGWQLAGFVVHPAPISPFSSARPTFSGARTNRAHRWVRDPRRVFGVGTSSGCPRTPTASGSSGAGRGVTHTRDCTDEESGRTSSQS